MLRWLLPPRCVACTAPGAELCPLCEADLRENRRACGCCALPLPSADERCGACQRHPPPYVQSYVPLLYAAPVDRLLTRFKFHAGLAEGRVLSSLLLARVRRDEVGHCEAIVPMPLHRARLARRGYNQALELARPLARAWGLPLQPGWLQRVRATAPQSELDAAERPRNLRGAFRAEPGHVEGRHLLLLDDVVTTGATVREAAKTLLAAGAARVDVLALARAPEPSQR